MGLWDAITGGYGQADPFLGRVLGFDRKDREAYRPKPQYAGGSKEASEAMQARYERGQAGGGRHMREGIDRTNAAADRAGRNYGRMGAEAAEQQRLSQGRAAGERGRALGSAGQMTGVADREMVQDRQRMIDMADRASGDYQRTADAQLAASQDSTQRQALAQGSRGGAGGLRAAMAGSLNANQQAANQAQITNAQEHNQLMGMKADMYGRANDIANQRAAVYGNAASLFSNREDAARNNALAQQGIQGNAIGARYGAQAGAGAQETGAGVATRGQYLGAETGKTAAELGAAREAELQRQQNEKDNYTRSWMPLKGLFNAPA